MDTIELTKGQRFLLEWLGKDDVSRYGECRGKDFDALRDAGLVHLHGPDNHPRADYFGCALTAAGYAVLEHDRLKAENEGLRALLAEVVDLAENGLVVTCDAAAGNVVDQ